MGPERWRVLNFGFRAYARQFQDSAVFVLGLQYTQCLWAESGLQNNILFAMLREEDSEDKHEKDRKSSEDRWVQAKLERVNAYLKLHLLANPQGR